MSINQHPLAAALKTAELLFDHHALNVAISRLGAELDRDYAGSDDALRPLFLTVLHGGLMFAGQLALATRIDFQFDYLHATRYRGATEGGKLHWIKAPNADLAGRRILLVDDILDEGNTLAEIRAHCREQGAADVRIAVLCEKRHGRRVADLEADYVGVVVPDRYVFGFGMDYYEQGRNLPGIYALK